MLIYNTPQNITAFSTTRDGGVSIDIPHLIMPLHQTHETTTRIIDEDFTHKNPLEQALALDGVDALCTHLPNLCICVRTADCIPVLLWDDVTQIVAAVHAGWKGTQKRIVESSIEALQETYGTQAKHLHAIIGPGIGPDSFEVGDEVYELFAKAGFPMERLAKRHPLMPASPLKRKKTSLSEGQEEAWHINLWECNRLQLIEKGVNPNNIHVASIDTYQNYDRFFSARRNLNGRIINGIMRKN
ncbi:MAG: peptidoglycan editing factor PgeF [Bacteroidaceae bacterium]|nr:peptidoglycan editing factor PgeF [Bacteroidaceae bacterium]